MATSHKRETARRTPRTGLVAGSLAVVATGAAVAIGVFGTSAPNTAMIASDRTPAVSGSVAAAAPEVTKSGKLPALSRGGQRGVERGGALSGVAAIVDPATTAEAVAEASQKSWTTADLNLWTRPDGLATQIGEVEQGERVLITGRTWGERSEIVVNGESRWVTEGYFSDEKPPTLGGACTNGTSVASGVSISVKKVHAAVCANFREVSVYGTLRGGGGDHPRGKAVDIMISGPRGWEIANFVRDNASALGVSYVIYAQKIWSVERGGEGWRGMSNRGSATANHFDHVHVSVF